MIDRDGDENYEPYLVPLTGGFPRPLAPDAFAGRRSHLLDFDPKASLRVLRVGVARGVAEQGVQGPSRKRRGRDARRERLRRVRRGLEPRPHARDPRGRLHRRRHHPVRARWQRWAPRPLPNAARGARGGGRIPSPRRTFSALRRERQRPRAPRASPTTPAASASWTSTARARSSPLRSRASGTKALASSRASHIWRAIATRPLQHRRLLLGVRSALRRAGRARPRSSVCSSARTSSREASSTASTTTRIRSVRAHVLHGHAAHAALRAGCSGRAACPEDERAPARHLAGDALVRRGRVLRVARRAPRLRASLPSGGGARLRGAEAARVLRPRRPSEPGAAELRLVLHAPHPDPHARGLRGLRPQRARVERSTGSATRSTSTATGADRTCSTTSTR